MKNVGLLLKMGVVAIAAILLTSTSEAQTVIRKGGSQGASSSTVSAPVDKNYHQNYKSGVVRAILNPNLAVQKRGAVVSTTQGDGSRNCVNKSATRSYSISRANFNKLPADRKKFVLDHSDKYVIAD